MCEVGFPILRQTHMQTPRIGRLFQYGAFMKALDALALGGVKPQLKEPGIGVLVSSDSIVFSLVFGFGIHQFCQEELSEI